MIDSKEERMSDLMHELSDVERLAVETLADVYASARGSRVLDGPARWDRFVSRVQSAAWSSSLPRAISALAGKLETPALTGAAITRALAAPEQTRQELLRLFRDETTALVALVRALREERRGGAECARIPA